MYIRGFFGHVSDAAVRCYLAAYVRRRRLLLAGRAVAWAATAAVGCATVACAVDRLFPLPAPLRIAALFVTAAAPIAVIAGAVRTLCHRVDSVAAAAAIERGHPVFAHRLVTAASTGGSADLRAAVERDVLDQIATTGPARVPRRPAVVAASSAGVAMALFALLWRWPWLDLPNLTRRLTHPTASSAAVTTTRLTVRPGRADVVEGKPLTVTATVVGTVGPAGVTLHLSADHGQTWVDRPMTTTTPAGYAITLADVDREAVYTVSAGDAVSPPYAVHVRRVPAVVACRVRLDFPPGLHRPATSTNDLSISAPAGTTATVEITATVPLARATLSVGVDRLDLSATPDPRVRRARFVIRGDARVAVRLVSADGVVGAGQWAWRVHVQRDPVSAVPGFEPQQRAYRDAMNR